MRVYWRHFVCYSFMLTLLGAHVLFQYAVVPNGGDLADPPAGEIGVSPDLAEACEQWIGRRSLKVPKGLYVETEGGHAPRSARTGTGRRNGPRHQIKSEAGERPRGWHQSHFTGTRYAGGLGAGQADRHGSDLLGPQVRQDPVHMNQGYITRLPGRQLTPASRPPSAPSLKAASLADNQLMPRVAGSLNGNIGLFDAGAVPPAGSVASSTANHLRSAGSSGSRPDSNTASAQSAANDFAGGSVRAQTYAKTEDENPHHQRYSFTCTNIPEIIIKRKLGQGVTKQVYLGLHNTRKVAVKMVTRNVIDVMSCMKKLRRETSDISSLPGEKHKCYTLPNMKLMKEILLLNQLHHPNLLKLLGYCVRSEETDSTSLQEHGIVAVYEYGLRFYVSNLREWPWQLRLRTAIELADLLEYLQTSPLGSLRVSDFKDAHFLLKDGKIKLTDLDDVTSLEPNCQPNHGPEIDLKGVRSPSRVCGYDLKCIGGICPGYNAVKNLDNFNRLFFSSLLFGDTMDIEDQMGRLRTRLENLTISAAELKQILYRFMDVPFLPGYS